MFSKFVIKIYILINFQAVESTYPEKPAIVAEVVKYTDRVLVVIFGLEIIIKLFALGLRQYFTEFWCILECIVTMVSKLL